MEYVLESTILHTFFELLSCLQIKIWAVLLLLSASMSMDFLLNSDNIFSP